MNFITALGSAHKVERNAFARTVCVIPSMGSDLVAIVCHAFDLVGMGGDLLADGVEGRFRTVLFQDVEDLIGGGIPGSIIERKRDHFLAVGVCVVVGKALVDLLFGDLFERDTRL